MSTIEQTAERLRRKLHTFTNKDWGLRAFVSKREIGGYEVFIEPISPTGLEQIGEPKGFASEGDAIRHALVVLGM